MKEIHPRVPKDCQVVGALYDADDPRDLGEDMIDVSLPNGLLISAGWYPEGSPDGKYVVTVSDGLDLVTSPIEQADISEARGSIEMLAEHYSRTTFNVSNTADSTMGDPCVFAVQPFRLALA